MQPILRRLLFISILVLGLVWMFISRVEDQENNDQISAPHAGFLAPEFSLPGLDNTRYTLSNFRGKPLIINFWASWCPPCNAEMPAIDAIAHFYQESISIITINATYQDSIDQVEAFLSENKVSITVLLDLDGAVNKLYQVSALPTTFFIDSSGRIREIVLGGTLTEAGLKTRIEMLFDQEK